jgi:hypothetical protein
MHTFSTLPMLLFSSLGNRHNFCSGYNGFDPIRRMGSEKTRCGKYIVVVVVVADPSKSFLPGPE